MQFTTNYWGMFSFDRASVVCAAVREHRLGPIEQTHVNARRANKKSLRRHSYTKDSELFATVNTANISMLV